MPYLFTSESVSEGHPDKIADQISDAVLDAMLTQDPDSRVACETLVTTGLITLAGEIKSNAQVDFAEVAREAVRKIGYTSDNYFFNADSCAVIVTLHAQSPEIAQGVDETQDREQGAGDQGMMFGYAINETPEYMPMALAFSHRLVQELAKIRKEESALMPYLRPDAKAQVTIEYNDDHTPKRVHTIVVSTQHDEFDADEAMLAKIREDVINIVVPRVIPSQLIDAETVFHVNPTGKFVIGGPHGDAGLTGRKIIVDTYGGKGAHGGGAFSGKDASKVDRSAAYATRHIAKNLVAAGIADEALVQVAYAIGVAKPVSLNVNTYGTAKVDLNDAQIAEKVSALFDMSPKAIVDRLGLKKPIFSPSAAYGHMGRDTYEAEVPITRTEVSQNGQHREVRQITDVETVTFFPWEKLDYVDALRETFGLEAAASA